MAIHPFKRRRRWRLMIVAAVAPSLIAAAGVTHARESLGIFDDWGSFRDDAAARCYAIAEARRGSGRNAYATVSFWPAARVRGQIFIHLPAPARADRAVMLVIGERRFQLSARGDSAWAQHARMDAAIVAAMRETPMMGIAATARDGRRMVAGWRLAGAATAIDAAAVGCAAR